MKKEWENYDSNNIFMYSSSNILTHFNMKILCSKKTFFFFAVKSWNGKFSKKEISVLCFHFPFSSYSTCCCCCCWYFSLLSTEYKKKRRQIKTADRRGFPSKYICYIKYVIYRNIHQSLFVCFAGVISHVLSFSTMSQTMIMIKIKVIWGSKIKSMEIILLICTRTHKVLFMLT